MPLVYISAWPSTSGGLSTIGIAEEDRPRRWRALTTFVSIIIPNVTSPRIKHRFRLNARTYQAWAPPL